ncbi:MAG: DUF6249 domain-containing protein [Prevotella sp.]
MKQNMIIWVFAALMALLPSSTMMAAAQQHRHTPRTTIVDDKTKQQAANDSAAAAQAAQPDAAIAYSDTTSADEEEDYQPSAYTQHYKVELTDDEKFVERILDKIAESGNYIVVIVFIIFIGAPISILMMILYFIQQNRRDRIRLAETALKNGQPIPGTERIVYREAKPKAERRHTSAPRSTAERKEYTYDEDLRARGIKHLAIGLGLMVCCLAFWNNDFFGGIGFLIACFGAGQYYMARSSKKVVEEKPASETAEETEDAEAEEPKAEDAEADEPKNDDIEDCDDIDD